MPRFALCLMLLLSIAVCTLSACTATQSNRGASSGPIQNAYDDLDEADRDIVASIQRSTPQRSLSQEEASLLQASSSMTSSEYLSTFGAANGKGDYSVGGNDVLAIHVYEQPDLTRDAVPVSADGNISFPFIGQVRVEGMSTQEIETALRTALQEGGFLVDPQISVSIAEYKSKTVLVLGAVEKPGRYQLEAQETILDVLSKAEGVSTQEGGNPNRATLVRQKVAGGQSKKIGIELSLRRLFSGQDQQSNLVVQDGDVLYVPMADKVYVMGEVEDPGAFVMEDKDMTIVEAIGLAGGFTRLAAPNRVSVVRKGGGGEQVFKVNVDDITERGGGGFLVQPNDIVIVPESYF